MKVARRIYVAVLLFVFSLTLFACTNEIVNNPDCEFVIRVKYTAKTNEYEFYCDMTNKTTKPIMRMDNIKIRAFFGDTQLNLTIKYAIYYEYFQPNATKTRPITNLIKHHDFSFSEDTERVSDSAIASFTAEYYERPAQ